MSEPQTTFSLEYVVSVIGALGAAYMINANQPTFSPVITFFIVPILTAYVLLKIISFIAPKMNTTGANTGAYVTHSLYSGLNGMGYMEIFPPLFAVLILVVILLYNRNLG